MNKIDASTTFVCLETYVDGMLAGDPVFRRGMLLRADHATVEAHPEFWETGASADRAVPGIASDSQFTSRGPY